MSLDQLGRSYPPEIRPTYPHLLPEDAALWTYWLQTNATRLQRVWYDVHVGTAVPIAATAPPWLRSVADAVTRKRIDVVAEAPDALWVVELKPIASYTALGQAIAYARLVAAEYTPALPILPTVICAETDPDLMPDYRRLGVHIEVAGHPPQM